MVMSCALSSGRLLKARPYSSFGFALARLGMREELSGPVSPFEIDFLSYLSIVMIEIQPESNK